MASGSKFNAFVASLGNGVVDLNTDTLKCLLTNTAPVSTNTGYSSISANELANGAGYTTGGASITGQSGTQTGGVYTLVGTLANPTWTATGSMGPFRYAVIYDVTASGEPLIGWWDYGSSVTLTSGQTFYVNISSGILTLQ